MGLKEYIEKYIIRVDIIKKKSHIKIVRNHFNIDENTTIEEHNENEFFYECELCNEEVYEYNYENHYNYYHKGDI